MPKPQPFDLQIPAHIDVVTKPGGYLVMPLHVSNLGTRPIEVAATVQHQIAGWSAVVSPARFELKPGATATEHLRVFIPKAAGGLHNLHVQFAGAPLANAAIKLSGGVSDTIAFKLPALAVAHHSNVLPIVVAALLILAVFAAAGGIWRLSRPARKPARPTAPRPSNPDRDAVEAGK